MSISNILKDIQNGGFQNPITKGINSAYNNLIIPTYGNFAASVLVQATEQSATPPGSEQILEAHTKITNAYNKINELLGHTDRISGVDLASNGNLATISQVMNSAKRINDSGSCAAVLNAFGSIMNAGDLISSTNGIIQDIQDLLNDTLANINSITSKVDNYVSKVAAQIASDVAALATAQADVIRHSVAANMVDLHLDPCTSQILKEVMGVTLNNSVQIAAKVIRESKIKAIAGNQ